MAEIDYEELVDVARNAVRGLSPSAFPNLRDDIAHDVLRELLENDLLEGHPNPEALVAQAVKWRAIDAQRRWERAKPNKAARGEEEAGSAAAFPPSSWQPKLRHKKRPMAGPSLSTRVVEIDSVREAFESIEPIDRLILWRHDVEGRDYAAIAEEVDLAVGTTRNRASSARQRLRGLLSG